MQRNGDSTKHVPMLLVKYYGLIHNYSRNWRLKLRNLSNCKLKQVCDKLSYKLYVAWWEQAHRGKVPFSKRPSEQWKALGGAFSNCIIT